MKYKYKSLAINNKKVALMHLSAFLLRKKTCLNWIWSYILNWVRQGQSKDGAILFLPSGYMELILKDVVKTKPEIISSFGWRKCFKMMRLQSFERMEQKMQKRSKIAIFINISQIWFDLKKWFLDLD